MNFRTRYIRHALFILGCLCVAAPLSINAQNPSPLEVKTADQASARLDISGIHF